MEKHNNQHGEKAPAFARRIFVIGSYGCGNRGDDAILQSICQQFPEVQISATCGSYEKVSAFLPVKDVPCRLNEGFSLSVLLSMIKDAFGMLAEVIRCDILMYGGGSLVHDLTPYNLPFLFFWQTFAMLFRKKVCYYSMGVGPLEKPVSQRLSRFYLKRAEVSVRDFRGESICEKLGISVRLTADAAFAVRQKNLWGGRTLEQLGVREKEYICVTGCQWFESGNFWKRDQIDFSQREADLAECLRALAGMVRMKILFVPTVFHDAALGKRLREKLPDVDFALVPDNWNCSQMAEIIENSFLLFGMRMHSIIFAARQQVPFMALLYDQKVAQLLKRLGMEEYGIPMDRMCPDAVRETGDRVLAHYEQIRNLLAQSACRLGRQVEQESQRIRADF